ncbi:hypothetical protein ENBRE01_3503, partial [Enteropsectra breve]
LSEISFIDGMINSNNYQDILAENLIPYIRQLNSQNILFQQDNARPHVSSSTKDWLKEREVECMDWPPYSPDLNQIENLWGILVQRVYSNGRQFENKEELIETIKKEWKGIQVDIAQGLVFSMKDRMYDVLTKNGLNTKY